MKTVVSIPDEVFKRAEQLAKRSRRSRSELYASALDEYVARHSPDEVTDTMNRVCERVGDEKDAFVAAASLCTLDHVDFFSVRRAEADIEAGLRLLKRSGGQAPRSDDMLR